MNDWNMNDEPQGSRMAYRRWFTAFGSSSQSFLSFYLLLLHWLHILINLICAVARANYNHAAPISS